MLTGINRLPYGHYWSLRRPKPGMLQKGPLCYIGWILMLVFNLCAEFLMQFIGATMGTSELNIQTENGHIGMPSNVCCVVVEYCPGGALKSYLIKNRRRKLAFKVVVQLALDLARGSNSCALSIFYFILLNL